MDQSNNERERKTGNLIAYSSLILAILYVIHLFVILDQNVVSQMLYNSGQHPTKNAIGTIINSFRFTGVMYVLAYLAGLVALWNRHPYLWWFLFAAYVSHVLYNLVNIGAIYRSILDVKSWINTLPLTIVLVVSVILAIYMLVMSIKRKSTFNR